MLDFRTRYDFTDYHLGWNTYQGANGAKISIIIDGEEYMLTDFDDGYELND